METAMINAMCRCCASEGAFKDVKSRYHWMGEEEIYADMLKDCFDVELSSSEGGDGGICEVCITQLRNAVNFKKQVLHTEEQFKKHVQNKLFKPNIVKVEVTADDGNDSDDNLASEDVYSGPEFEIPIKTEVPEEPKSKKRSAASKATTSRAKKSKTEDGETSTKRTDEEPLMIEIEVEPTATLYLDNIPETPLEMSDTPSLAHALQWASDAPPEEYDTPTEIFDTKSNASSAQGRGSRRYRLEIYKHQRNIRTLLLTTNATPIGRYGGVGYYCCFCWESFPDPIALKSHTLQNHKENDIANFMHNYTLLNYIVKLDITGLKCCLCDTEIMELDDAMDHLVCAHKKYFFNDINNHIVPFRFDSDVLRCVICHDEFKNFKMLLEHMNTHFKNYVCDVCSAGFVNRKMLQAHALRHRFGVFVCSYCSKVFDARIKMKSHERTVHLSVKKRTKCKICGEHFDDVQTMLDHEAEIHGVQRIQCNCGRLFHDEKGYNLHVKYYCTPDGNDSEK